MKKTACSTRKGIEPLKAATQSTRRSSARLLLLHLVAGIAGGQAAQLDIGLADAPGHDAQHLQPRLRMMAQEADEIVAIEDEEIALLRHGGIGRAVAAVEQRQLAELVARPRRLQHDLLAHQVLGEDLDAAAAHDEHAVARIAEAEQHLAGRDRAADPAPRPARRAPARRAA